MKPSGFEFSWMTHHLCISTLSRNFSCLLYKMTTRTSFTDWQKAPLADKCKDFKECMTHCITFDMCHFFFQFFAGHLKNGKITLSLQTIQKHWGQIWSIGWSVLSSLGAATSLGILHIFPLSGFWAPSSSFSFTHTWLHSFLRLRSNSGEALSSKEERGRRHKGPND